MRSQLPTPLIRALVSLHRNGIVKQVPDTNRQEAKEALTKAARQVSPSEGREKVMRAARKILRD